METYEYVIWIWTFYAMSLPLRSRKVMAAIHPDRAREACAERALSMAMKVPITRRGRAKRVGRHGLPVPERPSLKKTAYMPLKSVGDIPTSFLKKREK